MSVFPVRHLMACVAAAFILVSVLAPPARAQEARQHLSEQQIRQTVQTLLQNNVQGGAALSRGIRNLLLMNHSALSVIVGMATSANQDQQSTIGSALGLVAQALVRTDPAFATAIQQAVAQSGLDAVKTAFASITGNVATAAVGGGGSGGPTGGGAPYGGPNGGPGGLGPNFGYGTQLGNYLTGATSAGSAGQVTSPF